MPRRPTKIRRLGPLAAAVCLLVGASSSVLAGCAHQQVQAAVPVLAPPAPGPDVRPMTVAPDTDASPPLEATAVAPSVPTSNTAPSVDIPVPAAPPPRRAPSPPPASESAEPDTAVHRPAPHIAPQLSPSDQQAFQRRIDDDSAVAQKNLQSVGNRQLNATQQDLADKIRTFLDQARDAGKEGDWARAENLAQKARLLSIELINSL